MSDGPGHILTLLLNVSKLLEHRLFRIKYVP